MFGNQDAINRRLMWTDGVMQFIGISTEPRRIVGVVADVDDENITPSPTLTVYHPFEQEIAGGRVFVHASGDPYALVPTISKMVRDMSADQVVERAATLDDVRAEVMAPDRLNAIVFGGFAALALTIAIVGVAGVLAFSVSGRTREFGIRLAIGSQPRQILTGVLREGFLMAVFGLIVGVAGGLVLWRVANSVIQETRFPGVIPIVGAAAILLLAAVVASLMPAGRASRVDAMQALRAE
jgi:ABC-type antimicrobial peptide transport system permease subunit